MELITNRIKLKPHYEDINFIVSSDSNELAFTFQWGKFSSIFKDEKLSAWAEKNEIANDNYISYEFTKESNPSYLILPFIESFKKKYITFLLGNYLINLGFIVDFKPIGLTLSCYRKSSDYNNDWNLFEKLDFNLHRYKELFEITFNIGSQHTLISKNEIEILDDYNNVKIVNSQNRIVKSKYIESTSEVIIANRIIANKYDLNPEKNSINYRKRYKELLNFFNDFFNGKELKGGKFISTGFDSVHAQKVSFDRNKMVFKNNNKDINPISGMRNYGVYESAPNATDIKFLFIFQNNDDANSLYKYLKNGYKGFPGLERYVNIPMVLADANAEGEQYKRLNYNSLTSLMEEYKRFEEIELPEPYYKNYFAIVIGPFDKDKPEQEYFDLKLELLNKGIPSQFINHKKIRKSSVFNYHLPNIAIGILAKLGGIPWRIDSVKRNELVIGFNQDFKEDANGKKKFLAGSVFFDNHGTLKRTFSFAGKDSSNEVIQELKNAVAAFLEENGEIERIIIHYHKSLSESEKSRIDKLLKDEFQISVPYAVVEINDTKSRIELAFDPKHNYQMPISGSIVRLSKKEYLLFNNNRFKEVAPVGVKDELPLKIKIHFADESGFSHKELIEQVYEFSRLIWKGLKQRSQPATCYYAREIARFKTNIDKPIPDNNITQTTPWII